VYTTGYFDNTADFDPGLGEFNFTAIGRDLFILKLNIEGDFIWAKNAGALSVSSSTIGEDIKIDDSGNAYITGYFEGTVDFDPGANSYNLSSSSGNRDIFVLKLNTSGDFMWAQSFGSESLDIGSGLVLDKSNNIYVTGYFRGIVDFDPGQGNFLLNGPSDISNTFILKLNKDGNFIWAGSFSGGDDNSGRSIALDAWDNIYTTGTFKDTTDFDLSSTVYELTADGLATYIHKMSQQCNENPVINSNNTALAVCLNEAITLSTELPFASALSYSWNSGQISDSIVVAPDTSSTYTVSVSYMSDTFLCTNSASVEVMVFNPEDILISDDVEICAQEETFLEATGGSSYLWNTGDTTSLISVNIEENQTYFITVTDGNGCSVSDSIIVAVNPLSDTTFLEFTTCDPLMVGTNSIVYFDQNECDSIVIRNTTLTPIPEAPVAPADLVIPENGPSFQVMVPEVPNATAYSWTVPTGVQILSGATTNTITIDWDGIAIGGLVCVSALNECGSSAMDCMEVIVDITDGLNDISDKGYSIFPNPANEVLNIHFNNEVNYEITLLDFSGRVVMYSASNTEYGQLKIDKLPSGVYWLRVKRKDGFYSERVEVL
jgi:hypothetical protein